MVAKEQKQQYGLDIVQKSVFSEQFTSKSTNTCNSIKI